ncbi:16S/23S rRNA (cytidine-2'-O)-methyltransferase, partial [Micromonospora globispora]
VEFFVWLRRGAPAADPERVRAVVAAGPGGFPPSGDLSDRTTDEAAR